MSNQSNQNNQQSKNQQNNQQYNNGVADGIKNTAGAAFHAVHSALETTENVAMNAVDGTANAINSLTGNNKQRNNNSNKNNNNQ
ncbi:MAG: hypothetical protein ACK4M9_06070 [Anaerobacillus sp.]|uniref:hypothetical protein n=1 Tax=Anaerobacillus sp. TaxID=1872506 RepID=UPI00391AC73F